jgi:hypothetical protein
MLHAVHFTANQCRLGVGATAKSSEHSKAGEMSAMDKLKRQLLGKGVATSRANPVKEQPSKRASPTIDGPVDDDDSEGEGRVGAISSKSASKQKSRKIGLVSRIAENVDGSDEGKDKPASAEKKASKRHSSFLDEVLSTKKKRKKQN